MKLLFVLHDPPYGSERIYNGLRWARQMLSADHDVRLFLFADSVVSTTAGQQTPNGYYNVEKMLRGVTEAGGVVGCCGTCLDARGIADGMMIEKAHRSSMSELAEWTVWADKIINM